MDQKIMLGGTEFVVPPLSARRCMNLSIILASLGTIQAGAMSKLQMQSIYDALLIAIQQGKPDMTIDELMDMPITIPAAINAVKIVSKHLGLDFEETANPQQPAGESASASPALNGSGIASSRIS